MSRHSKKNSMSRSRFQGFNMLIPCMYFKNTYTFWILSFLIQIISIILLIVGLDKLANGSKVDDLVFNIIFTSVVFYTFGVFFGLLCWVYLLIEQQNVCNLNSVVMFGFIGFIFFMTYKFILMGYVNKNPTIKSKIDGILNSMSNDASNSGTNAANAIRSRFGNFKR